MNNLIFTVSFTTIGDIIRIRMTHTLYAESENH